MSDLEAVDSPRQCHSTSSLFLALVGGIRSYQVINIILTHFRLKEKALLTMVCLSFAICLCLLIFVGCWQLFLANVKAQSTIHCPIFKWPHPRQSCQKNCSCDTTTLKVVRQRMINFQWSFNLVSLAAVTHLKHCGLFGLQFMTPCHCVPLPLLRHTKNTRPVYCCILVNSIYLVNVPLFPLGLLLETNKSSVSLT